MNIRKVEDNESLRFSEYFRWFSVLFQLNNLAEYFQLDYPIFILPNQYGQRLHPHVLCNKQG